jgi:2,3-bisphosphoglycerate-independent phosphoglycerate mutase
VKKAGGVLIVTADHGNCERMIDESGDQPHTAHTMNVVPVVMVNAPAWVRGLDDGRLSDVAPTVLNLMGMKQPAEMTGRSLIRAARAKTAAAQ